MTDLELLRKTFDQIKRPYITGTLSPEAKVELKHRKLAGAETFVRLDAGTGYADFYADFYFDADGQCLGHGVWE